MKQLNNIKFKIFDLTRSYLDLLKQNNFDVERKKIPASEKKIDHDEIINIIDSALDGWLTTGRFNDQFEEKFSSFVGVKHTLTVNSGSSANLIAFNTLTSDKLKDRKINKGDEVISVAAGFPTTINPIIQFGAVPVFVDINLKNYNIDTRLIEKAITSKTKAIMIAHTLGNPFDLDEIIKICKKNNLWLVEDCCDALGSTYKGKHVGTFGDIATCSFYPAHHITMGEGGAVFTNNDELKLISESFRDWGRDCYCKPGQDNTCGKRFDWQLGELPKGYDHKYTYTHLGYNLKITDMQAACGLAQLKKLDKFILTRKRNFNCLKQNLMISEEFLILPKATELSDPSWFGFPITLRRKSPVKRIDLVTYLEQCGVGTRLIFGGNLTRQPYLKNHKYRVSGNLDNSDYVMNNSFWVGIHPSLDEEMIKYIAREINTFLGSEFN